MLTEVNIVISQAISLVILEKDRLGKKNCMAKKESLLVRWFKKQKDIEKNRNNGL